MIRALALLLLLAAFVKPPSGWFDDVAQANALAAKANTLSHFGGVPAVASAKVFVSNDGPGALYITAITGTVNKDRDAAARVAIDSFLGAPKRAQLSNAKVSIAQSASRVDAAHKLLEATVEWRDEDAQTITRARLLIAGDSDNLVAVTAECVLSPLNAEATHDACIEALATLDPGVPADKRVALTLAPEGSEPPPPMAGSATRAPTMSDGSRTPLPPMHMPPPPPRTVDRRPVYVGAGIVVLAALFWWNRRRRDATAKLEKKDTDE